MSSLDDINCRNTTKIPSGENMDKITIKNENDSFSAKEAEPAEPDNIEQKELKNEVPSLGTEITTSVEEESQKDSDECPSQKDISEDETQKGKKLWAPVWDPNAQAYYWWNMETNQTTWINPEEEMAVTTSTETPDTTAAATERQTTEEAEAIPEQPQSNDAHNPLDFLLDRIDNVVKKKLDGTQDKDSSASAIDDITASTPSLSTSDYSQYYYSQNPSSSYDSYYNTSSADPYTIQAHFDPRTGRFKSEIDVTRHNPENLSIENRAKRQMQHYFDVDQYTEQVNAQRQMIAEGRVSKKKQLTRKEIEHFKKMKKEKKSRKAREWLLQ
ncbi:hypothetical protein BDF20DRAFT_889231 [Mycotypha africana]|uniref:uncharacterized protein n=1 Tax=Mycotypha africana TaxID=64632 RepID=UPI00230077DE|nr:uncharacterized protein BDF20DRAFT_889231 [Mycotypha africana]KAI8970088.1 hypothetical protein BDF20DRAFT_889231 [Mycotypha africana]